MTHYFVNQETILQQGQEWARPQERGQEHATLQKKYAELQSAHEDNRNLSSRLEQEYGDFHTKLEYMRELEAMVETKDRQMAELENNFKHATEEYTNDK